MSHPVVETAFREFSEVGRLAVIVELKLRLLTNKITEVKGYALAKSIAELESALLPYLREKRLIADTEKKHLELSRKIRNKIFHCEFEAAVALIEELRGRPAPAGAVTAGKLDEMEGGSTLDKVMALAEAHHSGKPSRGVVRVDAATTKDADVFGWLLNALSKGVLREGQKVAEESISVLDRVFDTLAKQDYERGKSES